MNAPARRMTAEEFAVWAEAQPRGRYELIDGLVVPMNAERSIHGLVKLNVALAFRMALKRSGLKGQVYGDGMAVRINKDIVHEPDSFIRLGAPLPDDTTLVTDPVIVAEVLSPGTGPVDTNTKLPNYFSLPSVRHYLVVNTKKRLVQHYGRNAGGSPEMVIVDEGELVLDPPGLRLSIDEFFDV